MKTLKYSRQRESIANYLKTRTDHPTAEQVYLSVKNEFPNISLGTVYRNLSLLSEIGIIDKITCGDSSEHFDANTAPHNHFICNVCSSVSDLEMDDISFINTLAQKAFKGTVDGHVTYFYGICESCKNKK
jgi:Fur family peroxide stress response transcriptional regulator